MIEKYTKKVIDEYDKRTEKSRETFEQGKKYLPGGNSRRGTFWRPYPTYFAKGKGFTIWDIDGNNYVDFINNMTSLIHGHAHPKIVNAIQEATERGTCYNWPTEYAIKLAKMLCDRIPSFERVRFTNSGTESTMMAIRLAIAYTGKNKILKGEGVYHGTHPSVDVSVGLDPEKIGPIENPNSVIGLGVPKSVAKDVTIFPWNNQGIVTGGKTVILSVISCVFPALSYAVIVILYSPVFNVPISKKITNELVCCLVSCTISISSVCE